MHESAVNRLPLPAACLPGRVPVLQGRVGKCSWGRHGCPPRQCVHVCKVPHHHHPTPGKAKAGKGEPAVSLCLPSQAGERGQAGGEMKPQAVVRGKGNAGKWQAGIGRQDHTGSRRVERMGTNTNNGNVSNGRNHHQLR